MKDILFSRALELFSKYNGNITSNDKTITISCRNSLFDYRVNKEHLVLCHVSVGLLGDGAAYPLCSDADETTYCILGGCGHPCSSVDECLDIALHNLERYKFTKKTGYEQLTLFLIKREGIVPPSL